MTVYNDIEGCVDWNTVSEGKNRGGRRVDRFKVKTRAAPTGKETIGVGAFLVSTPCHWLHHCRLKDTPSQIVVLTHTWRIPLSRDQPRTPTTSSDVSGFDISTSLDSLTYGRICSSSSIALHSLRITCLFSQHSSSQLGTVQFSPTNACS
jgi:hypothetical protein